MEPLTMDRTTVGGPLTLDCDRVSVREVNTVLQGLPELSEATVTQPRGRHNLAVGVPQAIAVTLDGNAGYFVGGLGGARDGSGPDIVVNGFVGWSVGENLMGGTQSGCAAACRKAPARARGVGASSSRATPRCGRGSRSRAAPSPSPATQAP